MLCLTLCDPMDCSPPGSSIHWISQARILSGLPFPLAGDLPDPGIKPTSALEGGFFTAKQPGKPNISYIRNLMKNVFIGLAVGRGGNQ